MNFIEILKTYIHYLIHPFSTHDAFLHPERIKDGFIPQKLSAYESLTTSWIFVIFNGITRIIILNFVILFIVDLFNDSSIEFLKLIDVDEFPGMYFIVLSSILDIIFYPLFGIFVIQFWEIIIRLFGNLLDTKGDLGDKAQSILAVYFSSSILKIIPIFGAPAHSLASMVLMYAGLRKQLNASPVLSVCIIFTPIVIMLGFCCVFLLLGLLML